MTNYPKRLIEVDLPIARISAHARREKSIRHGHISTLHIWWARRPLAACRAVICASLWPDPADELCPKTFREAAVVILKAFAQRAAPSYVPQSEGGASISDEIRKIEAGLSAESRARWEALAAGTLTLDPAEPADMAILRMALLDFIADFANWGNGTVPAYLETARRLTGVAHASLSDPEFQLPQSSRHAPRHEPSGTSVNKSKRKRAESTTPQNEAHQAEHVGYVNATEWLSAMDAQLADLPRPLVVDPFAGGGSIPLEALRVGADAFASDLNPIPVLLNKVVLEYIPKYGKRLAEEVRNWGEWIKVEAEKELAEFYPKDPDGATPIAYLWARTILSEAPGEGINPIEIPLIRSFWLCKKSGKHVALRWVRDKQGIVLTEPVKVEEPDGTFRNVRRPFLELFEPLGEKDVGKGTSSGGSATCPVTGFTMTVEAVRRQLLLRNGGSRDSRLLCVVTVQPEKTGRGYRLPLRKDMDASRNAAVALANRLRTHRGKESLIPDGKLNHLRGFFNVVLYGMDEWGKLFSARQSLALCTLVEQIRRAGQAISQSEPSDFAAAVETCLALALGKQADSNSTLCSWRSTTQDIGHTFGRQALPMIWDFAEPNIFSGATRDWMSAIEGGLQAISSIDERMAAGHAAQTSATQQLLPDGSAQVTFTDPPYYAAVPYADLSDYFYSWLKRCIEHRHPELFKTPLSPKDDECVSLSHRAAMYRHKDGAWFEQMMGKACAESCRVTQRDGIGVYVFASKETAAWEAMLNAVVSAGWTVTASWAIDTEMGSRLRAANSAVLASSVHIVARPRQSSEVGEWRDVLGELPKRIHEWMPRLAAEGVVGADAIFACLGPALEVFSRYSRVEKANGDTATLREYLEFVWAAVSTEALSLIFKDADAAGLEPDARLTAMWLWTLGGGKDAGGTAKAEDADLEATSDDDEEAPAKSGKLSGFTLEYDAARKIAQGLGVHLEQCQTLVEVKGDKARMLPVKERAESLFGKSGSATATQSGGKAAKKKAKQKSLFEEMIAEEPASNSATWGDLQGPTAGSTVLDRVHQSMILFAAGRGELLKRFLVEDGIGKDARFWKLAQSLSALYPKECEEKRWVDGVLARKKGLGL